MIKTISISLGLLSAFVFGAANAQTLPETDAQDLSATMQANWKICNETSFSLRIATAHGRTGRPASSGWDKLHSGGCMDTMISVGEPKYVFAESSKAHRGGIREWKGTANLCAQDEDFVADPTVGCSLQAMYERGFMAIDPDEPVTTLVEIDNFGSKATTAGVQRLLHDNGYDITRVDGIAGRRTSKTLTQFLEDQQLASNLNVLQQLEALETAALEKIKTIGLTLCNRSSSEVWAAIGRRRKGNWESRGWWKIAAEDCAQVFTESLVDSDLSFYASQTGRFDENGASIPDRALRTLAATPTQFCISESRFSVLGKDNCAGNGYKAANFRVLPMDKEGLTLELSDGDFAQTNADGLR